MTTQQSWPTGALNRETTLEVLTQHNAWRRGAQGPQTDPRMLGLALDAAIAALSQSQSAQAGGGDVVCPNCERLTEIRHCQACGCDFIPSPAAAAVPEGGSLRVIAKGNLRRLIEIGSTDRELMLKCLEELS